MAKRKNKTGLRRKGSLLIEFTTSMVAGSVIMLLAIKLVHQTFHLATQSHQRAEQIQTHNRLARQFRSDIHRGSRLEFPTKNSAIIECEDGIRIAYEFANQQVSRAETSFEKSVRRERFEIEDSCSVFFGEQPNPMRGTLTVTSRLAMPGTKSKLGLDVQATLGRWSEFSSTNTRKGSQ
jgi:hypothetical protein